MSGAAATRTIDVSAANSPPAISALGSQTVNENDVLIFSTAGGNPLSVTDAAIGSGIDKMTLLVTNGTLTLGSADTLASSSGNGTPSVVLSGTLAALDAALDGLTYFPSDGFSGLDTLSLALTDDQGAGDSQTASGSVGLTVSAVAPIASAPSFAVGPDQIIPTGVGAQSIPNWASGMSNGLPSGSGGTLSFVVSADDNPGLFSVLPVIDPDGTLTYTPAPGAAGTANITVRLVTTPSTGSPIVSDPVEFAITLGAVVPQLVTPPAQLLPDNWPLAFDGSGTDSISVAGDTDTSAVVTVTLSTSVGSLNILYSPEVTGENSSLMTITGSIADVNYELGTLILYPTTDQPGSGVITVSLSSNSTGSQGGSVSVSNTIPLTVIADGSTASDISIALPSGQSVPENQWLTLGSATGNPVTINADPAAEAEVTIALGDDDNGPTYYDQVMLASTTGLTMAQGTGFGDSFASFTGTVADINAALDGLELSPLDYGTLQLVVVATLLDSSGNATGGASFASTTIEVRHAPSFNAYTGLWLADQPQRSGDDYVWFGGSVSGTEIDNLLVPAYDSIENVDFYAGEGIAVTGLDTSNGTWQFSSDAGGYNNDTDWRNIGMVSDTNALLLNASDSLLFIPNVGFFGDITDAVTFRLWDTTSGTDMNYADTTDNGWTSAFSSDTATAALRILPLVSITNSGGGGQFTISTTSPVPTDLDVSGDAGFGYDLPFTVTIAAGQKSTNLDLSALADETGGTFSASVGPRYPYEYAPTGYGYSVDPSAYFASSTETGSGNNYVDSGGLAAATQNGNTIEVTFYNSIIPAQMTWWTADGTAVAGTDYEKSGGTFSGGQTVTFPITLDNLEAPGDSSFFIGISTTIYGHTTTAYQNVVIQTVGLQLLADSNNDGRIDAMADAKAAAAATASGSGGVFLWTDQGNDPADHSDDPQSPNYDPMNSGQALVASDRLVEIDLDFNVVLGTDIELLAQGDTQDFKVWTSPDRTTEIDVADGTVWSAGDAPRAVWAESDGSGEVTLLAAVGTIGDPPTILGNVNGPRVLIESGSMWQAIIKYDSAQKVGANPAPTFLLDWNEKNVTPILLAAPDEPEHYQNGNIYLSQQNFDFLSRYVNGLLAPEAEAQLGSVVRSLTNEGFHAWYDSVGKTSWVKSVIDRQTQYQEWYWRNPTIGRWVLSEEAMSETAEYYSTMTPDIYNNPDQTKISAKKLREITPGHGDAGESFAGIADASKPLTEEGYLTALWVLYNGSTDPGADNTGSRLPALQAWFIKTF